MECVNCGVLGHSFRDCTEPVMSFGIAAVKFVETVPHYLLIRRRDSLAYVDFLRGKYKLENPAYIQQLLNDMTRDERARLIQNTFDDLWNHLWNHQHTHQYRRERDVAKHIFNTLRDTGDVYGRLLRKYVEETTTEWTEPEWGFPKGRRGLGEPHIACALREFKEETGLTEKHLHIVDTPPLVEEYIGSNTIRYRQFYFVGGCEATTVAVLQPQNHTMTREVGGIGWFPFEEAYLKIRSTNPEKRGVLGCLHHCISSEGLGSTIRATIEWTVAP